MAGKKYLVSHKAELTSMAKEQGTKALAESKQEFKNGIKEGKLLRRGTSYDMYAVPEASAKSAKHAESAAPNPTLHIRGVYIKRDMEWVVLHNEHDHKFSLIDTKTKKEVT